MSWKEAGIGMAAGAANGALGQIFGLIAGEQQDRRQIKQAEKLQKMQIEGSKEMGIFNNDLAMKRWKETNAPAQVEQLKKAGLNAGLMYGGGGGGGGATAAPAGSVSGQSTGDPNAGVGMGMQMASQLALQESQKKNIDADTNLKNIDAAKKGGADTDLVKADTDLRKTQDLIAKEIWTKTIAESQVANRTIEAEVAKSKAEAIGAELQNEATKTGIKVDKAKIEQMAAQIAQGWAALDQGERKLKIDAFANEIKANYPGVWNVAGKYVNDFVDALNNMVGQKDYKKHEVK